MNQKQWVPYVAPMAIYMAFLLVESPANVAGLYPLKAITVAGALWYCRRHYVEWQQAPPPGAPGGAAALSWAVLTGFVAIVIWIALDPYYPKLRELQHGLDVWLNRLTGAPPPPPPAPAVFDPTTIGSPLARWTFIGSRVFGAVVVVAFMEELFWRGFLIRWLVNENFRTVPLGVFTWTSFLFTTGLFAVEHDQWLAGLICGALYNGLFYWTKSLRACIVAHAVSNAVLAVWVLATGAWQFW